MIIDLTRSKLFTTDPDSRFSRQYAVPLGFWTEMWRRYKMLGYTTRDLCDFFEFKAQVPMSMAKMRKWLFRSEIYHRVNPLMKQGAVTLNSLAFGNMEQDVLKEITRHMKFGEAKDCKTII